MTGAYVAIAGVVIFTIAVFLDWATPEGEDAGFSGYESDSLLPFAAFLGIGFTVALLYAASRAYRRQHRGLSLASMAVGLAVTLQALAWVINVPGAAERQSELNADLGTWVGLVGAAVWAIGSGMLANEPEGDIERDRVRDRHERSPGRR
jgi:ABC-type Fe3+-siderophore transport system permease subunit